MLITRALDGLLDERHRHLVASMSFGYTCKPSVKLYHKSRKECFDRQFFQLQILTKKAQVLNSSHNVAYNPNARRAYEKSEHAEDFGRIKIDLFLSLALAVTQ